MTLPACGTATVRERTLPTTSIAHSLPRSDSAPSSPVGRTNVARGAARPASKPLVTALDSHRPKGGRIFHPSTP